MYLDTETLPSTKAPFHPCLDGWRSANANARIRGYYIEEEKLRSRSWDCCAIGEARSKYPYLIEYVKLPFLDKGNHPKDRVLFSLGFKFYSAVEENKFNQCDLILDQIEQRLNELIVNS
ncbi:MAG TPA: hypothetical protein VNX68_16175 [Nitrosopumilaceae archaeon]|jgi:hypothetical protein|nr:hypothetical protein [Nitrosopumilaceae archaeon]